MSSSDGARYLSIYLNDHLAGSVVGVNRARRAARDNDGTELGAFLARTAEEIDEDREALLEIMRSVGVRPDPLKTAAARIGELAGRLKFNGALVRKSPMTPFVELELLAIGITGKLLLWRVLRATPGFDAAETGRIDTLIARAERQRDGVEERRVQAGARIFAS